MSRSSANSLLKLLGIWLLMVIMLPKTVQALGSYFYPAPGKLAFRAAIEEEVIQYGDSHDPEDPHFNSLKDSVLNVHQVASVDDLPFNYGGFVMKEGERISATIYTKHHAHCLINTNNKTSFQIGLPLSIHILPLKIFRCLWLVPTSNLIPIFNVKQKLSLSAGSKMNDLQINYISPKVNGSEGKKNVVDRKEWQNFQDFHQEFLSLSKAFSHVSVSFFSMIFWMLFSILILSYSVKKTKVV